MKPFLAVAAALSDVLETSCVMLAVDRDKLEVRAAYRKAYNSTELIIDRYDEQIRLTWVAEWRVALAPYAPTRAKHI